MSPPNNPLEMHNKDRKAVISTPNLLLRAAQQNDTAALFPIFADEQVMRYWSEPPHASIDRTREWVSSMVESEQNGVTDFIITFKPPSANITTAAEVEGEGQVIGKIGIYSPWPSNEIGFLLSRAFWGRGLAYEALEYMLEYLFSIPAFSQTENETETEIEIETDKKTEEEKDEENNSSDPASASASPSQSAAQKLTTLSTHEQRNSAWRYASITSDVDPRNAACLRLLRRVGFEESGFVERTWCVDGEWVDSVFLRLTREEWLRRRRRGELD